MQSKICPAENQEEKIIESVDFLYYFTEDFKP
jgi:hypothetical protein